MYPLIDAQLEAAVQAGYAHIPDLNVDRPEGVSRFQLTQRDGLRCSTADAYLHPAAGRPNLEVRSSVFVERIVFEGDRAVGVEIVRDGRRETVRAEREVILAAGSYQSPVLLMHSGIGPADDLGAPRSARDATTCRSVATCRTTAWCSSTTSRTSRACSGSSHRRTSPCSSARAAARSPPTTRRPAASSAPGRTCRRRTSSSTSPASIFFDEGLTAPSDHGYCFGPVVIKPTSRGSVTLRTPMPDSKPKVVCNFLTTEEDRRSLVEGVRIALEIAAQPALKAVERAPFSVPASGSEEDIMAWAIRASQTVYHPTSTCAMGSVVDSELRVYGTEGLRVVDASVMPTITRANTHAPTVMIAEKAADMILGKTPLAAAKTPAD